MVYVSVVRLSNPPIWWCTAHNSTVYKVLGPYEAVSELAADYNARFTADIPFSNMVTGNVRGLAANLLAYAAGAARNARLSIRWVQTDAGEIA